MERPLVGMLVTITPLGSATSTAEQCSARVIEYLDGRQETRGGRLGGLPIEGKSNGALVGYFADSVEGPGVWMGRGIGDLHLSGTVATNDFRQLLSGVNPATGERMVGVSGSAQRAHPANSLPSRALGHDELVDLATAGRLLGVSPQYLRRMARCAEQARQQRGDDLARGREPKGWPPTYLDARRDKANNWWVSGGELERFRAARVPPAVIVGYDMTASVPKSVSILWAIGDGLQRDHILAAVQAATKVALTYLEDSACYVRSNGEQLAASGFLAASYLHATSRALDPQLHRHTVIANAATTPEGQTATLDGRALFAHQKTAGYLAGAELRFQLRERLGVGWGTVVNGLADIDGVGREVIAAMSKRSSEIDAAMELVESSSPAARQVAAYDTRAAKVGSVELETLERKWVDEIEAAGLDLSARLACVGREPTKTIGECDRDWILKRMLSAEGVTERSSTFTRQDVIQRLSTDLVDRANAYQIAAIADWFLEDGEILQVETPGRRSDQGPVFTTKTMVALERELVARFEHGIGLGVALVEPALVDRTLRSEPRLGSDQGAMVMSMLTSGHRVQCVVGPAGSGKTTALRVACRAYEAAGYVPIGCSISGTATQVLGEEAGIASRTVSSLLTRLDTSTSSMLSEKTVIIVDESSTLSNRDLLRLMRHVDQAGAALRLIGDPAQHSAVLAGGGWRFLLQRHPNIAPALTEQRRQIGPDMESVKIALKKMRDGDRTQALHSLASAGRVSEFRDLDSVIERTVGDWYADRQALRDNPTHRASSITTTSHALRREVVRRARQRLVEDGTLNGPVFEAQEGAFQAGDEVIARVQDRMIRSAVDSSAFLRNGTSGRVVAVDDDSLTVRFDRLGIVIVPLAFMEQEIRPGVIGGLAHDYCLTTVAAQGQTHQAGRTVVTDAASPEAIYVGLSRGRTDAHLYVMRHADLSATDDDPDLPYLRSEKAATDQLADHLRAAQPEALAIELDPKLSGGVVEGLGTCDPDSDLFPLGRINAEPGGIDL